MNNNTSPVWKKRGTRQGLLRNALLKAMNFEKGATTIERNAQIGGHKSGE